LIVKPIAEDRTAEAKKLFFSLLFWYILFRRRNQRYKYDINPAIPAVAVMKRKLLSVPASAWLGYFVPSERKLYFTSAYLYALNPTPKIGFFSIIFIAIFADSILSMLELMRNRFTFSI
jgi:hypothetical protein